MPYGMIIGQTDVFRDADDALRWDRPQTRERDMTLIMQCMRNASGDVDHRLDHVPPRFGLKNGIALLGAWLRCYILG